MSLLLELANKYGSDKGSRPDLRTSFGDHLYTNVYEELFEHRRKEPLNILEIGLEKTGTSLEAPSLSMWREYFPEAIIFGYDCRDFSGFKQYNTFTFKGDQSKITDLENFAATMCNNLDIVIDDGSHISKDQQISLGTLFKYMNTNGLYIIEDLCWQPSPDFPKTADVLRNFITTKKIQSSFLSLNICEYLNENIKNVEIRKPGGCEMGVIIKK